MKEKNVAAEEDFECNTIYLFRIGVSKVRTIMTSIPGSKGTAKKRVSLGNISSNHSDS